MAKHLCRPNKPIASKQATLICRLMTWRNCPRPYYCCCCRCCYCFYEAKLCLRQVYSFGFFSADALHCISLLPMVTLKFAVICFSATPMYRRKPARNCRRPFYHYCFSWKETLFALVNHFAFLQSRNSAALCSCVWQPWNLPSVDPVQRWFAG